MPGMHFAVTMGTGGDGRDPRGLAEAAVLAEQCGWDGVFLEDYLVYQGHADMPTFDPWTCLAAMASATARIKVGLTVAQVPRRKQWELAAQAVALDHLSGGRLILGVGSGDVGDQGFTAVGEPADTRTRAELLDEGLAIIAGCGPASRSPIAASTTGSTGCAWRRRPCSSRASRSGSAATSWLLASAAG
jgi:alkanesulfonate monooxygenase SsuD/methylene tetrahydromethanopterin reductase-like flavin-dependent oxidoreductase (luciferase family)